MAKYYSKVSRSVWSSERLLRLGPPPPDPVFLFLFLLTCEANGAMPGLLKMGAGSLADEFGWSYPEAVRCLAALEAEGMIEVSTRPPVVWLPKAIEHDQPTSVNAAKSWAKHFLGLLDCPLTRRALAKTLDGIASDAMRYAMRYATAEGRPEACAMPCAMPSAMASATQEQQQEQEQELTNAADAARGGLDESKAGTSSGLPQSTPSPMQRGEHPRGGDDHGSSVVVGGPKIVAGPSDPSAVNGGVVPSSSGVGNGGGEASASGQVSADFGADRGSGHDRSSSATPEQVKLVHAEYRKHMRGARVKPTPKQAKIIRAALKEYEGAETDRAAWEIARDVVAWVFTSSHDRAQFLRAGSHTSIESILRAGQLDERRMFSQSRSLAETDPIAYMQRQGIERDRLAALRDSS